MIICDHLWGRCSFPATYMVDSLEEGPAAGDRLESHVFNSTPGYCRQHHNLLLTNSVINAHRETLQVVVVIVTSDILSVLALSHWDIEVASSHPNRDGSAEGLFWTALYELKKLE